MKNWWNFILVVAVLHTAYYLWSGKHFFYRLPPFADAAPFYLAWGIGSVVLFIGIVVFLKRRELK